MCLYVPAVCVGLCVSVCQQECRGHAVVGPARPPGGWAGLRSGGGSLWSLRIWPLPARGGGKVETIKAEGRDMPDSELLPAGKLTVSALELECF